MKALGDFYDVVISMNGNGRTMEIIPDFKNDRVVKDLLVRGQSFYAVWNEKLGMWSTNILDVVSIVDADIWKKVEEIKATGYDGQIKAKVLSSDLTGSWRRFLQYLKGLPNSNAQLDEKLTFADTKVKKSDYASKRLSYSLAEGDYSAWDKLVGTLYSEEERQKIEWAIGAVVSGDSRTIQKFFVFYGDAGTGKSTILNIIEKLFSGYTTTFEARALASSNNQFATEVFKDDPLVAIQHDGDLSRIEDNTKLNSIVSHERMTINQKNKAQYTARFNCFLFMGTNRPVKITDGKSGIKRRLIDISPTGNLIPTKEYDALMSQIDFQLGAIAYHCLQVYKDLGKNYYKNYKPNTMIRMTDPFYSFVSDDEVYDVFCSQNVVTLKQAYSMYCDYCDKANLEYKKARYIFAEELKNYFQDFKEVGRIDGKQARSCYIGFKKELFEDPVLKKEEHSLPLVMDSDESLLDDILAECPAQYAVSKDGSDVPEMPWAEVTTRLRDLDTRRVHFVLPKFAGERGKHLVMIDFDIRGPDGEKNALLNAEAASKWPATYAECSKGGAGIHLIFWYTGDVSKVKPVYDEGIEIKVFRGNAAMRRRVSKCNTTEIATLSEGALPLKEDKVIDISTIKDEGHLRNLIKKCLRKGNHGATRPEIDLIKKSVDDALAAGISFDVEDMLHDIFLFAAGSTHQSDYCKKVVRKLVLHSPDREPEVVDKTMEEHRFKNDSERPIVFFDVEVFPNLLVVNWKLRGKENPVNRMINPSPLEIEKLFDFRLVGFNNRRYDNHILYGRYLGLSNQALYDLSQAIIVEGAKDAFYHEAFNVSYTDIFDFCSIKQSLKKWEIMLNIHHKELGLKWDEPVPEELWEQVAAYCDNDVIATEAVFEARQGDFIARQILADIAGGTVNDTTNQLTTKFIFGDDRHPKLVYTDLSDLFPGYEWVRGEDGKFHNMYRGVDLGRGGYVYAEKGFYTNVALIDIQSMHPTSAVQLNYFGEYTKRFEDILNARIAIKKGDYETARQMFGGALAKYLDDESNADALAQALKIAINAVYGLTSASFDNPFRDKRNVNNIVALRGALFMKTLQDEVVKRGYKVIAIRTDSIKIPNATPEIVQFCVDFAKQYGYVFDHEAVYDRMCLVNDAVYIAAYMKPEECERRYGYACKDNVKHFKKNSHPWTATGAQFQQPYVFKELFSGEPIEFSDYCETKSVSNGAIYLDMNEGLPDVSDAEDEMAKRLHNKSDKGKEKPKRLNPKFVRLSDEELAAHISSGHSYQFVGRVGLFTPIRKGLGGGEMLVLRNDKYSSVTGTKDFRWLETEMVQELGKTDDVDTSYYARLANEAIASISEFCDFERFVDTGRQYIFEPGSVRAGMDDSGEVPWSVVPCGDGKRNSCLECPNHRQNGNDIFCASGYRLDDYVKEGAVS